MPRQDRLGLQRQESRRPQRVDQRLGLGEHLAGHLLRPRQLNQLRGPRTDSVLELVQHTRHPQPDGRAQARPAQDPVHLPEDEHHERDQGGAAGRQGLREGGLAPRRDESAGHHHQAGAGLGRLQQHQRAHAQRPVRHAPHGRPRRRILQVHLH